MYVLGVVGPEGARTRLVERLIGALDDRGRVATVEAGAAIDLAPVRTRDVSTAYVVGDDGEWAATGVKRTLAETLDELAVDHDYAILDGFEGAGFPRVVLEEAATGGADDVLARADHATEVDVEDVLEELEATEPYETLGSLVARAKASPEAEKSGAIATFTGRVRAREHDEDQPTEYLEFEKYEGVAEERLASIEEELEARNGVFEVLLHHRTGIIEDGEDIVFVVVLAGHREEAFKTVEDGINRLKDEVPIFKREVTVDGEFWVHTRA